MDGTNMPIKSLIVSTKNTIFETTHPYRFVFIHLDFESFRYVSSWNFVCLSRI